MRPTAEPTRRVDSPVGGAANSPRTVTARPRQTDSNRLPHAALPLNFFQQAMMLWDRIHPYNAVHALRIEGRAQPQRLAQAAADVCAAAGIGDVVIRGERLRYGPPRETVVAVRNAGEPDEILRVVADTEMNAAFDRHAHHPLRWTVFEEPGSAAHWIVLSYHHVIADAPAIEMLLARVTRSYLSNEDAEPLAPLELKLPGVDPFAHPIRRTGFLRALRNGWRRHIDSRSAHKMPDERDGGNQTHTCLRSMPPEFAKGLAAACKIAHIGVNDVFLAALGAAIAAITPDRASSRRRRRIALGTVLNGRRFAAGDLSNFFGVCLSDAILLLNEPDAPLSALLAEIVPQTAALKRDPLSFAALSALRMLSVRRLWPTLFIPHTRRNYRRIFPICGGVSSYSVHAEHFGAVAPRISRYIRVCPPGPAMPIVLAPTRVRDSLELSLVCRHSCMSPDYAAALLADIERRLMKFGSNTL